MAELLNYATPERGVTPRRWVELLGSGVVVVVGAVVGAAVLLAGLMLGLIVFGVWA